MSLNKDIWFNLGNMSGFSPSGQILVKRICLEVKAHLRHEHQLLKHKPWCLLADDGSEVAQQELQNVQCQVVDLELSQPRFVWSCVC